MGGYGSGRWGYHSGRPIIDECRRIRPRDMRTAIARGPSAYSYSLSWKSGNQDAGNIGFYIVEHAAAQDGCALAVRLVYTVGKTRDYDYLAPIERTTHAGLSRYWFHCPACGRRCGVLALPPSGGKFVCRQCGHFTYQSCNDSHKFDRLFGEIAGELHLPKHLAKLLRHDFMRGK